MKKTNYKGLELQFNTYEIKDGLVYIEYGQYIYVLSEEEFNKLEITEE